MKANRETAAFYKLASLFLVKTQTIFSLTPATNFLKPENSKLFLSCVITILFLVVDRFCDIFFSRAKLFFLSRSHIFFCFYCTRKRISVVCLILVKQIFKRDRKNRGRNGLVKYHDRPKPGNI